MGPTDFENLGGKSYDFVSKHGGSGVFHRSRKCAGHDSYDSDMTESVALEATIDGEMRPCGNCCTDFPIRVHDNDTKTVGLTQNASIKIPAQRIEVVKDRCDISADVLRVLDDKGFHQ